MPDAIVQELRVHPLKSARALVQERVRVVRTGLEWDRHWMATRPDGTFLSQRTHPRLARIQARPNPEGLRLECAGHATLCLPLDTPSSTRAVRIWKDTCTGEDQGEEAAAWVSAVLDAPARLIRSPAASTRRADRTYAGPQSAPIAFVDGFPLLVCNQASLDALNAHLPAPIPMERFRPNVVLAGLEAFAEDRIEAVRIGTVTLRLIKPCTRCVIPAQDQHSGLRDIDPLTLLRSLRFDPRVRGAIFGVNALIEAGCGTYIERGASCQTVEHPGAEPPQLAPRRRPRG